MKKILFTLVCISFFGSTYAQKTLPEIKKGTTMLASAFLGGQEFPLTLTIKSLTAPFAIDWTVEGYGDGTFEMSEKALEGATQLALGQPALGTTKLADDETFGLIAKTAFKSLTDNKFFTYNGIKFLAKTADGKSFKIGDKEIDVIYVTTEDSKIELWILNNPNLPFIMQSSGLATDVLINALK